LLPNFDRPPEVLQQEHKENLNICDAVIIYYGEGNDRWTDKMVGDLMRLKRDPANPLLEKIIYKAGPETDEKKEFISNEIIIDGQTGINETLFTNFFAKLK
jgi:hypothetical protein